MQFTESPWVERRVLCLHAYRDRADFLAAVIPRAVPINFPERELPARLGGQIHELTFPVNLTLNKPKFRLVVHSQVHFARLQLSRK